MNMIETNQSKQVNTRKRTLVMVQFAILLAILAVVSFSPLGSIPITPIMVATLAMVPVIVAALLMGTLAGTLMGLFAGIFSLIVWLFIPPASFLAILFSPLVSGSIWSVVICIVPRVLVGTVTGLLFAGFRKINKSENKVTRNIIDVLAFIISAAVGSFTNTVLVLWGGYLIFNTQLAELFAGNSALYEWVENMTAAVGWSVTPETAALTAMNVIVLTNGVPELILSAVVGYAVCKPVRHILKKQNLI